MKDELQPQELADMGKTTRFQAKDKVLVRLKTSGRIYLVSAINERAGGVKTYYCNIYKDGKGYGATRIFSSDKIDHYSFS